ncbi:hypothetical protein K438DRAFT_2150894 [Mycena galopus ATCC 62051]|nr:hypothetical protein K438DRAFT_2150894 [Mycena galopus ATCC 62051]
MTSRPARNRQVAARLTDSANGEALGAVHQNVLAAKPTLDLIKKIGKLSLLLPDTVEEAPADDNIHRIITKVEHPDGTVAATFNRRFDILFGEDTRGSDGRLKNIRCGDFGMGLMAVAVTWANDQRNPVDHRPKRSRTGRLNAHISFTKDPGYEQKMDDLFQASIKTKPKPSKKKRSNDTGDDSDTSYTFRNPRLRSEEADDDFEVTEIERPPTPEGSGKRRRVVIDESANEASESRPKKKAKQAKQSVSTPSVPPKVTVVEIEDSDDEKPDTKRGPSSTSRDHFHPPVAVKSKGEKRWEFKCRHCKTSYTLRRTLEKDARLHNEKPQPSLGNLATHMRTKHDDDIEIPTDGPGMTREISEASAKIMESFLREGKLNPALNPTQIGFNRVFAAWIIEDDLAFTTGETPGIKRVFDYIASAASKTRVTCLPSHASPRAHGEEHRKHRRRAAPPEIQGGHPHQRTQPPPNKAQRFI